MEASLPLVYTLTGMVGLLLIGVIVLIIAAFVLIERTSRIEQISYRLENVEDYLRDLSSEVNSAQNDGDGQPMFRSMDGKYTASSLEELVSMMMADPESGIGPDASPENLQKFFEQLQDPDDDEDSQEPWKKKKKD